MPDDPAPDAKDLAILELARRVMNDYDPSGYSLDHKWIAGAGMWFVEIEPRGSEAAPISLYHGGDIMNIFFGATWFEFDFELSDVPAIEAVLRAICEGDFEQAGSRDRAFARIYVPGDPWHVGHVHLWPWRWRKKTRFQPYAR